MRLDEVYEYIRSGLTEAGIKDANIEARVILRELAQVDAGTFHAHPEKEISSKQYNIIKNCVDRRLMREPLQYILGRWDFMGLNFCVNPGVLIPRPDTELLVETALEELHDGMRILDLCTGTGCIAISLSHYSNDCHTVAVDISEDALKTARVNAENILGNKNECDEFGGALKIIKSDLYENVRGKFELIVSNPPYINTDVCETLEAEVKDFEPRIALDGGADGLDLIRRIIEESDKYLCGGGTLILEIGYDQGERVCGLMKKAGYKYVECIKDYAGLDRVVKGKKTVL